MRSFTIIIVLLLSSHLLWTQSFSFSYEGPDTLFVGTDCQVALDWGHPDQPTVSSTIGAIVDSFFIFSISNDFELNELIEANQEIEITYKAVDNQGNSEYFTFEISIWDSTFPLLITPPANQTVLCDDDDVFDKLEQWYDSFGGMEASDNCQTVITADQSYSEVLIAFNQSINQNCGNTKEVTVFFTLTDEAGNALTPLAATFESIDNVDPVYTSNPSPLNETCSENIDDILEFWIDDKGGAEATDNCSNDLVWSFNWIDNLGNSNYEIVGNTPYDLQMIPSSCDYAVTVSFIVEDECGNKEAKTSTITITDTDEPIFLFLPTDTTVNCQNIPALPEMSAFDACQGDLIVLFQEVSNQDMDSQNSGYYNYQILQQWTTDDGCGHQINHERTITVKDDIAPEFDPPGSVSISCHQINDFSITGEIENLYDNCSEDITISYEDEIGSGTCNYQITRTWKAEDLSGNQNTAIQLIEVVDDQLPVLDFESLDKTVSCEASSDILLEFYDWINDLGSAQYHDDCNEVNAFAAVPGSYNIEDISTFPGTSPDASFLFDCQNEDSEVMFEQNVDFVFYDECGNAIVLNRSFQVLDQQSPQFLLCPSDTNLVLPIDACDLLINLSTVEAIDNCTGSPFLVNHNQTFGISSQMPGDKNIPVDTMVLNIGPIDLHNLDIIDISEFALEFYNIDADDVNEFFVIRGEDGEILGTTPEIDEECGDFVVQLDELLTTQQIEDWLADSYLQLTLEPNVVEGGGVFSINDICENSHVVIDLLLESEAVSTLEYQLSIDKQQIHIFDNSESFDTLLTAGEHSIKYTVMDCAGNETLCEYDIGVLDQQAPKIHCPEDQTLLLPVDTCSISFALELDFSFDDNCLSLWTDSRIVPLTESDQLITFSYDENSDQFRANNKDFVFENIPIDKYLRKPELKIFFQGDFESPGEGYEILDEMGQVIASTAISNCNITNSISTNINEQSFNQWANDGSLSFFARVINSEDPVNPCDDLLVINDGDTDGISKIYLELNYEILDLSYFVEGATNISETKIEGSELPPNIIVNGGISTLHYILGDPSGNRDTCAFDIEVKDDEKPHAICKGATAIFIQPSGVDDYILIPEEIDNGSYDNCGIDSMAVVPSVFDCSMSGQTIDVMLYVWDSQANVDSCLTSVKVETAVLEPSYEAGICAFDTLKLFANLPEAPDGIYSILWTKDNNGFSSNEENPVRPNADQSFSGTYTLEVTGLNNCTSTGFVEVFIEDLSTPSVDISKDTLCLGESLIMETNTYSGNVVYRWFEGIAPDGILVQESNAPILEIQPSTGEGRYYVIVESPNCVSLPSASVSVLTLETPIATVNDPFITLCEGDELVLGSVVSGQDFTYQWWGPDSFESFVQNPQSIANVEIKNQGRYNLAIFNGICSDTTSVQVLINERPQTPEIIGDEYFCQDENIVLSVSNITNADTYSWFLNDDLYTVQSSNTLLIPGAQDILSGEWEVVVREGTCYSDTSAVHDIEVEIKYEITAQNTGPVCEGDSVMLSAPDIPGAIYTWETPGNELVMIQNPVVKAENGLYRLEVLTNAGCELISSTLVQVVEIPQITALSNNAPTCIDGTECIEFVPSVFPNLSDYNYYWSGPNDYESFDSIPELCEVNPGFNGNYQLYISNGICYSDTVATTVNMTLNPVKPILDAPQSICENDTISLGLFNYSGSGFDYFWSTPNGNVYQNNMSELQIPNAETGMTGYYSIHVFNGICYSEFSDSVFIEILDRPNQPVIWSEGQICEGDAISLFTQYIENAEYFWTGPDNFSSSEQNPIIFPSDTLAEGVYRLRIIVEGCESKLSEGLAISIVRKPDTPKVISSIDPICISDEESILQLCLESIEASTSYIWYYNNNNIELGNSSDLCFEMQEFEGFEDGQHSFYAIASNDGCLSDPSTLVFVNINVVPEIEANAGEDLELCNDEELFLDAKPDIHGSWKLIDEMININDFTDPKTQVTGLLEGDNLFIWSLTNGVCIDYDRDTVNVRVIPTPQAFDDNYVVDYQGEVILDPLSNDNFIENASSLIDFGLILKGQLEELGFEQFNFVANPGVIGEVEIPYRVFNEDCPEKWDEAIIRISIGDENDCFGVNVITPNGDGKNDVLLFPCLESGIYNKNLLLIFNQWGDEVFSASPYLNDWEGTYKGKELPVGTYYYVLDLNNGSGSLKGFFVIER